MSLDTMVGHLSDLVHGRKNPFERLENRYRDISLLLDDFNQRLSEDEISRLEGEILHIKYQKRKGYLGRVIKNSERELNEEQVGSVIKNLQNIRNKHYEQPESTSQSSLVNNIREIAEGSVYYRLDKRLEVIKSELGNVDVNKLSLNDLDELRYSLKLITDNYYLRKKVQKIEFKNLAVLKNEVENKLNSVINTAMQSCKMEVEPKPEEIEVSVPLMPGGEPEPVRRVEQPFIQAKKEPKVKRHFTLKDKINSLKERYFSDIGRKVVATGMALTAAVMLGVFGPRFIRNLSSYKSQTITPTKTIVQKYNKQVVPSTPLGTYIFKTGRSVKPTQPKTIIAQKSKIIAKQEFPGVTVIPKPQIPKHEFKPKILKKVSYMDPFVLDPAYSIANEIDWKNKYSGTCTILNNTPYETNVHFIKGKKPGGKTVYVLHGGHGNETGAYKTASIFKNATLEYGNLIVMDQTNVPAIRSNKRFTNEDLNRQFASHKYNGTHEDRIANYIVNIIKEFDVDLVISLHDGSEANGWAQTVVYDKDSQKPFVEDLVNNANMSLSAGNRYRAYKEPVEWPLTESLTYFVNHKMGRNAIAIENSKSFADARKVKNCSQVINTACNKVGLVFNSGFLAK